MFFKISFGIKVIVPVQTKSGGGTLVQATPLPHHHSPWPDWRTCSCRGLPLSRKGRDLILGSEKGLGQGCWFGRGTWSAAERAPSGLES